MLRLEVYWHPQDRSWTTGDGTSRHHRELRSNDQTDTMALLQQSGIGSKLGDVHISFFRGVMPHSQPESIDHGCPAKQ